MLELKENQAVAPLVEAWVVKLMTLTLEFEDDDDDDEDDNEDGTGGCSRPLATRRASTCSEDIV
jgi:hypothetical protein